MKKALVFIIAIVITGCVNSRDIIDQSAVEHIESGSKVMVYHYPSERSALYDEIYKALLKDGFRIDQENEERGVINTEPNRIGQGTISRISIIVEEEADSSKAIFRTEWRPDKETQTFASNLAGTQHKLEMDFKEATWGNAGRSERAYAYTYKFIQQIDPDLGKEAVEHRR